MPHHERPSEHAYTVPGLIPLAFIMVMTGAIFGVNEVVTLAVAEEAGQSNAAGPILALYAVGSAFAGLVFGHFSHGRNLVKMLILGTFGAPVHSADAPDQELLVFAAASLTNSLDEIGAAYTQQTQQRVKFSYAASSALARQLEATEQQVGGHEDDGPARCVEPADRGDHDRGLAGSSYVAGCRERGSDDDRSGGRGPLRGQRPEAEERAGALRPRPQLVLVDDVGEE